jgi:DNA invertase Pin-like site-specific DNA recombinase
VLIGYARISTDDKNLALQHDALTAAGCEKIYGTGSAVPGPSGQASRWHWRWREPATP